MVILAQRDKVDGYTSDWRISRHPRIKLLSKPIIAYMRCRFNLILALIIFLLTLLISRNSDKVKPATVDVSWPNCRTAQTATYASGIIGVTGGLDFHTNPCLAKEASWLLHYNVYINTGYPGNTRASRFINSPDRCNYNDSQCLAYNYGFNAAEYAINYADLNNVHSSFWWLDVETENSWTNNFLVNRQFINGVIAGIKQKLWLTNVGIYSAPNQWQELMGSWRNQLPEWLATGTTSHRSATLACHTKSFTAGPVLLTQFTTSLDQDLTCTNIHG